MFNKIDITGLILITLGVSLVLTNGNVSFFYFIQYALILIGAIIILVSSLITNNHKNLLCRIGLHKYRHVSWEDEMKSLAIYKCNRCTNEKVEMRNIDA